MELSDHVTRGSVGQCSIKCYVQFKKNFHTPTMERIVKNPTSLEVPKEKYSICMGNSILTLWTIRWIDFRPPLWNFQFPPCWGYRVFQELHNVAARIALLPKVLYYQFRIFLIFQGILSCGASKGCPQEMHCFMPTVCCPFYQARWECYS